MSVQGSSLRTGYVSAYLGAVAFRHYGRVAALDCGRIHGIEIVVAGAPLEAVGQRSKAGGMGLVAAFGAEHYHIVVVLLAAAHPGRLLAEYAHLVGAEPVDALLGGSGADGIVVLILAAVFGLGGRAVAIGGIDSELDFADLGGEFVDAGRKCHEGGSCDDCLDNLSHSSSPPRYD